MKQKKVPMRMCVGCREMKPKRELLRVVRTEGGAVFDTTGKLAGRGAYVCKSAECLKKAAKTGALSRALEMPLEDDTFDRLHAALEADNA